MRMHRWVTGPGGRGDVVVCQWAASLPVRAGCGGAGLARHTIRCPTLRARTATPLARPHACTQPRPRVHCPGSLHGAGLGCVPRCACRRERCPERSRPCVYVRGRPRDAGPGCVPRCGRHRCLCHKKSEPCANSTHTAQSRSVPSVTSAPCRSPRSQVSEACAVAGTACVATAGEEGGAADRRGGGASFCQVPRAYAARLSLISNGGDLVGQQAPGGRLGASRPRTQGPRPQTRDGALIARRDRGLSTRRPSRK